MTLSGTSHEALNRAPAGDVPRVLLADDEPLVRRWVQRVLTDAGYELTAVEDGHEALQELQRAAYDVVLSDITMPRLSGTALLLASIERDPSVPVILMTGAPDLGVIERAEQAGVAQVLMKPMPSAAIAYAVGRCVRLRRIQLLMTTLREGLPIDGQSDEPLRLVGPGREMPEAISIGAEVLRAIEHDVDKQAACRSLVGLCDELRLLVVATGMPVSDAAQGLRAVGCDVLSSGEVVVRRV